jgi:hypothetical protein
MLTFSHPGSRIQGSKRYPIPDPGSRIRIRNTEEKKKYGRIIYKTKNKKR